MFNFVYRAPCLVRDFVVSLYVLPPSLPPPTPLSPASMLLFFLFFFNDTATTEIYTLSLHDALPIRLFADRWCDYAYACRKKIPYVVRSEEHTSELQSHDNLVCRLLLEKKKIIS